ncbi:uncharacterized protein [Drosophila virilis]|uniref:Uncharacterized protein, isoform A n=1 Tax=Drosophila virilis TaxID=7244 RepID=B4LN20_DROVI|nr:putative cyclin-dependent serine/threonine-protein kinase DDB_G0272797/DDB_G0274007 [Drosophila virilis]EDW62135.1 uncharacterized protein Dvir_GJ19919, isoform A [Drosophila virilis]KRF80466.1 uncharacterized protein Dvir_GJ19919, isoform B [Drosophila virilis]KRF80467.1 uncharacterized protein Dvir_GJ19919, isoform C [Drosophila virilis]
MQYLNYALQTSTRLLTSQSHSQSQSQSQTSHNQQQLRQRQRQRHSQTAAIEAAAAASTPIEEQIAHACCSRGAQLLRLRQQELIKRRALELEDQLNANDASWDSDPCSSEAEEGAVGGGQQKQEQDQEQDQEEENSNESCQPVQ